MATVKSTRGETTFDLSLSETEAKQLYELLGATTACALDDLYDLLTKEFGKVGIDHYHTGWAAKDGDGEFATVHLVAEGDD
jgi:hypothetical protein